MPKSPRGEKRHANTIARAVQIAKIPTGEIHGLRDKCCKNPHAKAPSAKKRSEINKKATSSRRQKAN